MLPPVASLQPWRTAGESAYGTPLAHEWPVTDFATAVVPAVYEPRYAYPLILWLCGDDCPATEATTHIAGMSPQNYVGLAVEECIPEMPSSGDVGNDAVVFFRRLIDAENRLISAVRAFRRQVNVHTERIFLAGAGDSAATALLMALHQPEWFGGCISVGGAFPPAAQLLAQRRPISGRRFWLSASTSRNHRQAASTTLHAARQLIASGADVTSRLFDSDRLLGRATLRAIDEWIISGILNEQQ